MAEARVSKLRWLGLASGVLCLVAILFRTDARPDDLEIFQDCPNQCRQVALE